MEKEVKIRNLFPAGNTTQGFVSFFDFIINKDKANHLYSIKGGPGTGKSSIMKKIGNHFTKAGYDVEYHHCSSDPDSLDAVVIPLLKVALLDGTAPHVVDPIYPGAVDEIINLGEYWDKEKLESRKNDIIKITKENSRLFQKAYAYLKASGKIYDVYERTALNVSDINTNELTLELVRKYFSDYPIVKKPGEQRNLFAFGITPKGIINYRTDMLKSLHKKILIIEDPYSSSEHLMNKLKDELINRGVNVLCLHSPLKTNKILDIVIDDLDLIISVENSHYKYNHTRNYEIDLRLYIDKDKKEKVHKEVDDDIKLFELLLENAIKYIKKAKENHDILEEFYIDAINFSKHDELLDNLIKRIEAIQ